MKRPLFTAGLVIAVVTAFWLWSGGNRSLSDPPEPGFPTSGEVVILTGQVCQKDETSFSLKSNILYQFNQEAAVSQQKISLRKKIICETTESETVLMGATVTVKGYFSPFSEATNPGEFNSAVYYRSVNTCGRLRKAEILSQEPPRFWGRERLYQLRCFWTDRLYGVFPEREAAVMSALLLGDKTNLDRDLKALYQRNGILHILSISSLHITILGMGLYRILRRVGMPVWVAAFAGGLLMGAYGVMTGFGVSACRAIAMYFLRMLAEVTGRTYDMLNALGATGAGMLLYCPYYLENSGFLLSFSSILGIGVVYPALVRVFAGEMKPILFEESRVKVFARLWKRKIKEGILLSLSITLATMPVQLWFYYEIPVYSVFVNLLVLPLVKPLLIAGFAVMLLPVGGVSGKFSLGLSGDLPGSLSVLSHSLSALPNDLSALPDGLSALPHNLFTLAFILSGSLASEASCLILGWYEALCSFFDCLPFSVWNPGRPEVWQIVVYYCLLVGFVCKYGGTMVEGEEGESTKIGKREGLRRILRGIRGKREGLGRILREIRRRKREEEREEIIDGVRKEKTQEQELPRKMKESKTKILCGKGQKAEENLKWISVKRVKSSSRLAMLGFLCVGILIIGMRPATENQVFFLDVGQGDCSIVRTASGQTFLFDCGSSSRSNVGRYVLLPFLKYYGIRTIDGVLLSHPDTDHVNGALELFTLAEENGIVIKQLILPDVIETEREEALGELIQAAGEVYGSAMNKDAAYKDGKDGYGKDGYEKIKNGKNQNEIVTVRYISEGDCWQCGDAYFLCLHPSADCGGANANEYSMCIFAAFGEEQEPEMSVLFAGDVEGEGEKELTEALIRYGIHDITLLKTAHHGSRNSTSEELLELLRPVVAVISCGKNNRYGHPHEETLERLEAVGSSIYRTNRYGAVIVEAKKDNVRLRGYLCSK